MANWSGRCSIFERWRPWNAFSIGTLLWNAQSRDQL
jgi:hypothetical protein